MNSKKDFLPAAHYHFLTPFYEWSTHRFFARRYNAIADFIKLKPGDRLLDIGCGPGEMLHRFSQKYPQNALTGLDIDPEVLAMARKRVAPSVELIESSATSLPLPDQSFDVALSTLMIHHLTTEDKQKMIHEAYRVLKPGGTFYLFDFGRPQSFMSKIIMEVFRRIESLDDAIAGKYEQWMKETGFKEIKSPYHTNYFALWVGKK